MKKLILICTLALMAIACKEDDPQLILPDMGTHRNPAGPDSITIIPPLKL